MANIGESSQSESQHKAADPYGPHGPFGAAFQIIPGVQNYDWGITGGRGSLVAVYAEATEQLGVTIKPEKPYAELWMGTHPTLPSTIVPPPKSPKASSNVGGFISLSSYLNRHSTLLGDKVVGKYGTGLTRNGGTSEKDQGALPFLFKILSAGKALSIQAHPDKDLAKKLHREKPGSYKDDNHKPEMAVALTDFKGFCGFRPLSEIVNFLNVVPEFQRLVGPSDAFLNEIDYASKPVSGTSEEDIKGYLRKIFSPLMNAPVTEVKRQTMGIAQRYASRLADGKAQELEVPENLARLVCTLNEQFPGDVGVFCAFVLNVVTMQTGQAMFLKANEPHAYISGNIVECMAASDNVVRAGLTPKERDVDVLVNMLTYTSGGPDKQLMKPKPFMPLQESPNFASYDGFSSSDELSIDAAAPSGAERGDRESTLPSLLYDPPIEEFSVAVTRLRAGEREVQRPIDGPSILIVTSGKGKLIVPSTSGGNVTLQMDKPGKVFFVGAGTKVELEADAEQQSDHKNLSVFRAFVEVETSASL